MVIPLWDDNADRRTFPYVNYALIAVNVFVFVVLQQLGTNDHFTYAFAGVLGGYILLFPHKRVMVLLFRFITAVPAWVAVGMWFVFQLISGIGALGPGSQAGGVAYAAHVGGFVAGLGLVKVFAIGRDND